MYERYAEAAARYRPERIRALFVQESPPYAAGRHFYFAEVRAHDGLWLNLMRFLYGDAFGEDTAAERTRKDVWLRRFQSDGYFAIDAYRESIARLPPNERAARIAAQAPQRIAEVQALAPDHVVLVKRSVFDALSNPLREAGVPVANSDPVPFPGRGQQRRFYGALRSLADAGTLPLPG